MQIYICEFRDIQKYLCYFICYIYYRNMRIRYLILKFRFLIYYIGI